MGGGTAIGLNTIIMQRNKLQESAKQVSGLRKPACPLNRAAAL